MRSRRLRFLFRNGSIVLGFLLVALVVSVLLLSAKARFQASAIAQVPMQSMPSNPCSALIQRYFAAIPDSPTAILSDQVVSATAQTPEYCKVN